MHDYDEENDGKFPGESPVEGPLPPSKQEEQADRLFRVIVLSAGRHSRRTSAKPTCQIMSTRALLTLARRYPSWRLWPVPFGCPLRRGLAGVSALPAVPR